MNDSDAFINQFWAKLEATTEPYLGDITYLSNGIIYQGLQYPDGWLLYRTLPDGTEQQAMPEQTEFYRDESQVRAAMTWPDMVQWR